LHNRKRNSMFVRTILAALAVGLSVGAAIAQQDPVITRENLMKENNKHAIAVVRMMRGQAPFDAAAVDAAFAQWADTAQKLPSLFPDNSKTGGDNRASPKIWLNKKDFEAKAAAFAKAVAENHDKAKSSLDGLKAAIPVVGKGCDDCHKDYRLGKD
jgi:cytochrome c556